jgi:hypothetical protein
MSCHFYDRCVGNRILRPFTIGDSIPYFIQRMSTHFRFLENSEQTAMVFAFPLRLQILFLSLKWLLKGAFLLSHLFIQLGLLFLASVLSTTVRTILNRQRWNAGFSIITEANTNGGMRVSASASKNVRSIGRSSCRKTVSEWRSLGRRFDKFS